MNNLRNSIPYYRLINAALSTIKFLLQYQHSYALPVKSQLLFIFLPKTIIWWVKYCGKERPVPQLVLLHGVRIKQ